MNIFFLVSEFINASFPLTSYMKMSYSPFLLRVTHSGFKDIDALRKHLVDNLIGSAVWGLTFMYIRKWANPECRDSAWKNRQDGYFATLATFVTGLLKAVSANFAAKF